MNERQRYLAGAGALAAALILIIFGVMQKEPEVVLQRAVNICMECIGIG